MPTRRTVLIGAMSAAVASPAWAAYPERPVTIVVPNSPGGSTDRTARLFARALETRFRFPVVVSNMEGGGTSIGTRFVKDAAPDGHTVLAVHQALLTTAATGIANYGPSDFEMVALTGTDPSIVVVKGDSPYRTLQDLVAAAKARPGTLKAGVAIGALNHFALLSLARAADVRFRYVQTGGGGPSLVQLLGGHIDLTFLTLSDATQYRRTGDVRVLAVFDPSRHADAPDLATAREQGIDLEMPIKHLWWMPKGTPRDRVSAFSEGLREALRDPAIVENYRQSLTVANFRTGPELEREVEAEYQRLRELAQQAGLVRR
jgi:tripartite-type tricarboxylate transporter receptor subunit TctC